MQPRLSSGFTLVEVVVALALLVVVTVGVVRLFAVALNAGRAARDRTLAVALATGKIEQLRSLEWRFELDASAVLTPHTDTSSNLSLESVSPAGRAWPNHRPERSTPTCRRTSTTWIGTADGPVRVHHLQGMPSTSGAGLFTGCPPIPIEWSCCRYLSRRSSANARVAVPFRMRGTGRTSCSPR